MKLITVGGRIKSAAVGLNTLYQNGSADEAIRALRDKPPRELLEAYFPSDRPRIRQLLSSVGLFRPILKTDQGMGGNFLPFLIDKQSDAGVCTQRNIVKEEGVALAEPWHSHDPNVVARVQELFHRRAFRDVAPLIEETGKRTATKGRLPFFLIRPATTDYPVVLGMETVDRVSAAVRTTFEKVLAASQQAETESHGRINPHNVVYFQADVYVLGDGTVAVEKIHLPDVGLFLTELHDTHSTILPSICSIVRKMEEPIARALEKIPHRPVTLVTRDEVLNDAQDLLEQLEIQALQRVLQTRGVSTSVCGLSRVDEIPQYSGAILLNIDYSQPGAHILLERHARRNLHCFPNPYVQMASRRVTGLREHPTPERYRQRFLELAGSYPKNSIAAEEVLGRLRKLLDEAGVESDILHIDIGHEVVPVFTQSLYSWQQLPRRANRYPGELPCMTLRAIPATPDNLMLTSSTGPRLHAFRFMFINESHSSPFYVFDHSPGSGSQ